MGNSNKKWYWQISWMETKETSVELIFCNLSVKHICSLMEIYVEKWEGQKRKHNHSNYLRINYFTSASLFPDAQ